MRFSFCFAFFLATLPASLCLRVQHVTITIDGSRKIAETDDNFVCATIDWWPHDKCNYNLCPWGHSSAVNLNLSQPLLAKAIQAFHGLRIRIGGSLQDQVLYDVGQLKSPCQPFRKMKDGLFGFSKGCLHMNRWDELNHFFHKTGAIVTFGLNALYGRHKIGKKGWGGAWDASNAVDFIKYTISNGYQINSWEFGNELSGNGVGANVDVELYGKDLIRIKAIINDLYKNSPSKPLLLAPGGFFQQNWYAKFLRVSGPGVLNAMTHHIYNLGPGNDPKLVSKILDPYYLDRACRTFSNLKQTIEKNGPWASAWVGESGGAYNSGGRHVSNTFVDSFWYLDQLGMSSKFDTKVYCRQTLVGGYYGLLNKTTLIPNPDYYSALLWHRLMGKGVLAAHITDSPHLRVYAHCSKGRPGITLLLINLSNHTAFVITPRNIMTIMHDKGKKEGEKRSFMEVLKNGVSWVGHKASDEYLLREEYHLTPSHGHLQSHTMDLNGFPIKLTEDGDIPRLDPVRLNIKSPIYISPLAIAFIVVPNFDAPACA